MLQERVIGCLVILCSVTACDGKLGTGEQLAHYCLDGDHL